EILENQLPVVASCLDISPHRGRNVSPCKVIRSPQNETVGRTPVPPRAPRLLVIGFERRWWPPVQYLPHIRFVDPHPEGARRHNDVNAIGEEGAQDLPPRVCRQPGVIG